MNTLCVKVDREGMDPDPEVSIEFVVRFVPDNRVVQTLHALAQSVEDIEGIYR